MDWADQAQGAIEKDEIRRARIDFARKVAHRESGINQHPYARRFPDASRTLLQAILEKKNVRHTQPDDPGILCMQNRAERWRGLARKKALKVLKRIPNGGLKINIVDEESPNQVLDLMRIEQKEWGFYARSCRYPKVTHTYVLTCEPRTLTIQFGCLTDGKVWIHQEPRGHGFRIHQSPDDIPESVKHSKVSG